MPKALIYLSILILFSCQSDDNKFGLDPLFDKVVFYCDSEVLENFKNLPLDSAVIKTQEYPEIFNDAFGKVFKDSSMVVLFESYCEANDITLNASHDLYTLAGAFHKRLNEEKVK